ncbi:MAG: type II secretion system protein, partial [Planctomycetota bacterium]
MRTRHAFTMVELLVVISIIVLLMGILIPSIGYMQGRADITKTQARLTAIAGAIGSYQGDTGRYPLQDVDTLPEHLTQLLVSDAAISDL